MLYLVPIILYVSYCLLIEQEHYFLYLVSLNFFFLMQYLKPRFHMYVQGMYGVLAIFFPPLLFGLPLLVSSQVTVFIIFSFLSFFYTKSLLLLFVICLSFIISLLQKQNKALQEEKESLIVLHDFSLQKFQEEILLQEEGAILAERERISRDIHDGVGHLLSAASLQVGAVQAVNQEQKIVPIIDSLKELLQKSMDSMRESVHNLYAESINLEDEVQQIISHSKLDAILFQNDCKTVDMKTTQLFLWTIKEAHTNTQKHSDATRLEIKVFENLEAYHLLILDNGSGTDDMQGGLGLSNIQSRVHSLGGLVNIQHTGGFRIFVKIPKKKNELL